MTFWDEVLAIFIGDVFASVLLIVLYVLIQWFLRATDVTVAYNWSFTGPNFYPNFDIRNRSGRELICWRTSHTQETTDERRSGSTTIRSGMRS